MDRYEPLGCTEHKFMHEDHEILVDECVCKEDLCNEKMDPIPSPSTLTPKTTTPKGIKYSYYRASSIRFVPRTSIFTIS